MRFSWRCWGSIASQSAKARQAKQRKFAARQAVVDEQLRAAEDKAPKDATHSLYKVIKERVQLRDDQGHFFNPSEEKQALETYPTYSLDLFGSGTDFPMTGQPKSALWQGSPTRMPANRFLAILG